MYILYVHIELYIHEYLNEAIPLQGCANRGADSSSVEVHSELRFDQISVSGYVDQAEERKAASVTSKGTNF